MMLKKLSCFALTLLFSISVFAQSDNPKNEVRAVWIATVTNLDWPSSRNSSVSTQKAELINLLDELKAAGINIVFFQVRTEGDALYDSDVEPWSAYLTGEEGKAPDPYWDPLSFAVEEAHKRGMELHAWLNPYRAMRTVPNDFTQKRAFSQTEEIDEHLASFLAKEENLNIPFYKRDTSQRDEKHVSNTHPEWLLIVNDFAIFDPGLPEVMDYTTDIVMDIVNRYDVDGIHFDDYFYPYPPNHMRSDNPELDALDDETFQQYPRGFTDKGAWRRNNVNMLVEMIHDSIKTVKPWVDFGISPFGIWKAGVPTGIVGTSAYSTIYADGVAWLEAQTIDYITPQLYWEFDYYGANQDYAKLSNWWAERASENNRHIYPGHGVYKSDRGTFSGSLFDADEIPRQIRHNRKNENIDGSVFFRAKNISRYSSKGFADSLINNLYRFAALPAIMDWKDQTAPATPQNVAVTRDTETDYIFHLNWDKVDFTGADVAGSAHEDTLVKYAVYRVSNDVDPDEAEEMKNGANLIAVTGSTSYTDKVLPSVNDYYYFVTAASRNSIESIPSESVLAGAVLAESLDLVPESITIDTTMTFTPNYSIRTDDGVEHDVPRNTITWSLTNTAIGQITEGGKFTPSTTGETGIVAVYNTVNDTSWVKVTAHDGYVTLDNFSDKESWTVVAENLDENQLEITSSVDQGGIRIDYTLPANSSDVVLKLQKNIAIDGVPGFANIRTAGDGSAFEMSLDIANAEGQFKMANSTKADFILPDVLHYPFQENEVEKVTSGADFYFPFTMQSVNIEIPDNTTNAEVEGFVIIYEIGVSYTETPVSIEQEGTVAPDKIKLAQNYPNPFNPTTNISFHLQDAGHVTLKVYDVLGREVATIVNERLLQGEHTYTFNASAFSSGVYIYQLKTNGVTLTKKLTLIK